MGTGHKPHLPPVRSSRASGVARIGWGYDRRVPATIDDAVAARHLALVRALRPRQWTKNLLLFAGLVFAGKIDDASAWGQATVAAVAYSLASSAAYLANDLRDVEQDRLHPTKSRRPITSGELGARDAAAAAAALLATSFALAAWLGWRSIAFLTAFVAVQALYSLALKHVPVADVVSIAGLFVLRAAAGAAAISVHISTWLLVCTSLAALFLALAKRRGELVLADAAGVPGRTVLERYTRRSLDIALATVAVAALGAYAAYATVAASSDAMPLTVPIVAFGLARYLYLVHRCDLGEEPEQVLLTDRPVLLSVAAWIVTAALLVARA